MKSFFFALSATLLFSMVAYAAPNSAPASSKQLNVELPPVVWWPDAPFDGKAFAQAWATGYVPRMLQIQKPTALDPNTLIPDSPFPVTSQLISKSEAAAFSGRLFFISLYYARPSSLPYAMFRGLNTSGQVEGKKTDLVSYRIGFGQDHFFPIFSANGRSLLFQSGDRYESNSANKIYLWDFFAKKLTFVGITFLDHDYQLSPDAIYLAYHRAGGNAALNIFSWEQGWSNLGIKTQLTSFGTNKLHIYADLRLRGLGTENQRKIWTSSDFDKELVLATDCSIRPIVWTQQGTLLYTANPTNTLGEVAPGARASINEVSPADIAKPSNASISSTRKSAGKTSSKSKPLTITIKPRVLVKDAYDPSPSHSGRYIAFYGWRENPTPLVKPTPIPPLQPGEPIIPLEEVDPDDNFRFALFVFDRQTKTRTFVADGGFGRISWTPDDKGFVVQQPAGDTQVGGAVASNISPNLMFPQVNQTESTVSLYRLADVLKPKNNRGLVRDMKPKPSKTLAKWSGLRRAVSFSKDGVLLFLADTHNIYALDLRGGDANNVETVAHIEDPNGRVLGCDWLDEGSRALPIKKATIATPTPPPAR